ncbi:MAG: hypothetical protein ACTJFN_01945 [Sphingobacterium sp.]
MQLTKQEACLAADRAFPLANAVADVCGNHGGLCGGWLERVVPHFGIG